MTSGHLDDRFSDPAADAAGWGEVETLLSAAELYWLTTVRADGRPHVTPLVGLWHHGAFHFTTGTDEQKSRNLDHSPSVVVTTGVNTWADGTDVVVEGAAERALGLSVLQGVAAAYVEKYGDAWSWQAGEDGFHSGENLAEHQGLVLVYRVAPTKVFAFAKDPHAQTTFRF